MIRPGFLPAGVESQAMFLLIGRALRAFVDGYVAVLLPAYLLALGFDTWQIGMLATMTLLGSALTTLAVGAWGHYFRSRRLLLGAALLMSFTGFAFAAQSAFWPLLLIAFLGTLNPSSGDVSVFLPLEHARLAEATHDSSSSTALFARYSLLGALLAALGALAAALPDRLVLLVGMTRLEALRWMFVFYGFVGCVIGLLYRHLPESHTGQQTASPLDRSRPVVLKLAALFSIDAFAGGLVVNSLLALWLFKRFDLSLTTAGAFFFWAGLLTACSQLVAPWLAKRVGLINTMVFTHIPANLCLIGAAFAPRLDVVLALLLLRSLLSQMDVPTRSAFVMAVVTPEERAAAASLTAVPRSLASAISPALGGALFTAGWLAAPLLACGLLKILYDLLLWFAFRRYKVQL